ncbi:MAG: hypothetical protein ACLRNW_07625 [Neglectibacter sp.]
MLYSFIDRVEVHQTTGGRTITASRTSTSTLISSAATTTCWNCVRGRTVAAIDAGKNGKSRKKADEPMVRKQKIEALRLATNR